MRKLKRPTTKSYSPSLNEMLSIRSANRMTSHLARSEDEAFLELKRRKAKLNARRSETMKKKSIDRKNRLLGLKCYALDEDEERNWYIDHGLTPPLKNRQT